MQIARLRTNTVEFTSTVRGAFSDFNTAGVSPQSFAFFLNYPTYYRNNAGSIAQLATVAHVFASEQKVFDEYKVSKLQVMYQKWLVGQIRVSTAVALTAPQDPLLILGSDNDDSADWTGTPQAYNTQGVAIHHVYSEPSLITYSMVQPDSASAAKWLNVQAAVPNQTTPPDPNNPSKLASIKAFKAAYQAMNTTEGVFFCEWTVHFRGVQTIG
jgi:hypothetical protein